jgi:hypothetical protein
MPDHADCALIFGASLRGGALRDFAEEGIDELDERDEDQDDFKKEGARRETARCGRRGVEEY